MRKKMTYLLLAVILLLSGCSKSSGFSLPETMQATEAPKPSPFHLLSDFEPDTVPSPDTVEPANAEEHVPDTDPTFSAEDFFDFAPAPGTEPLWVILDMDYYVDVDDVCALRIAAMLDRAGLITLKAVIASSNRENCPKAIHAQLSLDGLPDVPVGRSNTQFPVNVTHDSEYWQPIIDLSNTSDEHIADALALYKDILREADAQGKPVRVITTGFLNNISALLSDEEGRALSERTIDYLYITGGEWKSGYDFNFCYNAAAKNAAYDVCHTETTIQRIYSTFRSVEYGNGTWLRCGRSFFDTDERSNDPVATAFLQYWEYAPNMYHRNGQIAWDPFCVWVGCLNDNPRNQNKEKQTLYPTHVTAKPFDFRIDYDGQNRIYLPGDEHYAPSGERFLCRDDDIEFSGLWFYQENEIISDGAGGEKRLPLSNRDWYESQLNYWLEYPYTH